MHRIQLDNDVFEGENAVYLLGDDTAGPTTLIDTGIDTDQTERTLRDELAVVDVTFEDIDQILLTHYHGDHAGLAETIQAESDATVRIHRADAEMLADPAAGRAYFDLLQTRLDEWGMPEEAREELLAFMTGSDVENEVGIPVEPLADGASVYAGERELEVVHLPGHTAGQSGFLDRAAGDLYAGDAVLPVYTPNVGGADVRVDRALAQYADSLVRVIDLDPDRILPGHRSPIADPAGRARAILGHHHDRTRRVVRVLAEHGPATPWQVSARLFGSLENIHILHGPGESFAHLDHLADHDVVARQDRRYELLEPDADVSALLPTP